MSNWLSKFWDHNRNSIGNAVKNVSPFLAFTPLGPLGSMAAGALGEGMEKGANLGSIAHSGLSNAAIGSGMHAGLGALRGAFSGGAGAGAGAGAGSAGGALPGSMAPSSGGGALNMGGAQAISDLPSAGQFTRGLQGAEDAWSGAPDASQGGQSVLGRIADFAEHHPDPIGRGLQGLGALATSGSENRLRAAQTQQIQWEMEMQKRREAALEPLRRALAGAFQGYSQPRPIAPNPYASTSPTG